MSVLFTYFGVDIQYYLRVSYNDQRQLGSFIRRWSDAVLDTWSISVTFSLYTFILRYQEIIILS